MKIFFFVILISLMTLNLSSQEEIIISGKIKHPKTIMPFLTH